LGVAADQITPTANKLTISGKKAVKTPYTIPDLDYTTYFLNGTAINSSGLALVNAYSFGGVGAISRPRTTLQRRALWNKLNPPLVGTATQVIANLKHRIRPTTTSTSPSGYYLLSTTQPPIPLGLPDGASGVSVFALNDQGISVGVAYTGDPNNPTVVPYYWDVQGDAFPMQLTSDLTFGYPLDINDFGTVVGQVGNGITTVGAMWNAVDAPPTNLNSLVPAGFPYNVQEAISIGNDFTVAAAGNSTTDTNSAFYFGLRPR